MNLKKCEKCHKNLIDEEQDHECIVNIVSIQYDTDNPEVYYIFDGKRWYPMKFHQPKLDSQDNQPQNGHNHKTITL